MINTLYSDIKNKINKEGPVTISLLVCTIIVLYVIVSLWQMGHLNYLRHYQFGAQFFDDPEIVLSPVFPMVVYLLDQINSNYLVIWPFLFFIIYMLRHGILSYYLKDDFSLKLVLLIPLISILILPPFYELNAKPVLWFLPNEIKSPTTIFAFPFSIALYIYFIRNWSKHDSFKFLYKIGGLSLLVFLIKPSFVISFLPAVLIWTFLKSTADIRQYFFILILVIGFALTGVVVLERSPNLGVQFLFGGRPFVAASDFDGTRYVWGGSLLVLIKGIFGSFILPIYVFLNKINLNEKFSDRLLFSGLVFIISLVIALLFVDHPQLKAGNFVQAMNIPANIFIFECIIEVLKKKNRDYFALLLIALSVLSGIKWYAAYFLWSFAQYG